MVSQMKSTFGSTKLDIIEYITFMVNQKWIFAEYFGCCFCKIERRYDFELKPSSKFFCNTERQL